MSRIAAHHVPLCGTCFGCSCVHLQCSISICYGLGGRIAAAFRAFLEIRAIFPRKAPPFLQRDPMPGGGRPGKGDGGEEDGDDDHPCRPLRSFCRRCGRDGRSLDGGRVVRAVTRVAAEAGRRQSRAMGRHHFPGRFHQAGAAVACWRGNSPKGHKIRLIFRRSLRLLLPKSWMPGGPRGAWRMVRRRRQPGRCWHGRPRGRPRWPA
jgi:hypothetical protein